MAAAAHITRRDLLRPRRSRHRATAPCLSAPSTARWPQPAAAAAPCTLTLATAARSVALRAAAAAAPALRACRLLPPGCAYPHFPHPLPLHSQEWFYLSEVATTVPEPPTSTGHNVTNPYMPECKGTPPQSAVLCGGRSQPCLARRLSRGATPPTQPCPPPPACPPPPQPGAPRPLTATTSRREWTAWATTSGSSASA